MGDEQKIDSFVTEHYGIVRPKFLGTVIATGNEGSAYYKKAMELGLNANLCGLLQTHLSDPVMRTMYGKIIVHFGPMFAEKTHALISEISHYDKELSIPSRYGSEGWKKIVVIKHVKDVRFQDANPQNSQDKNSLRTHDGYTILGTLKIPHVNLSHLSERTLVDFYDKYEIIIIDEGQFFKKDEAVSDSLNLDVFCRLARKLGKITVVAGIVTDVNRQLWNPVVQLIPHADISTQHRANCRVCGKKAIYTRLIKQNTEASLSTLNKDGNFEAVAGNTLYEPVCSHCYEGSLL